MFEEFGLLKHFAVPHDTLHALILGARAKYRADNAFHNFYHAFSVTHATFLVLVSTPALHCLTHVEVMAVLVAALCHDIDHPGHNNAYEINSSSELAIRHNDDAVLERHHAHTTFELLQSADGSRNIFAAPRVSAAQWRRARRVIVEAILATDMSKHFGMIAELSERIAERTGATSLPDASPSLFADSAGVADRARSTSEAHLTLPSLLRTPNWGRMSSTDTVGSRKAKGAVPTCVRARRRAHMRLAAAVAAAATNPHAPVTDLRASAASTSGRRTRRPLRSTARTTRSGWSWCARWCTPPT